jgi:REP element-mobilizing transposase RayT
MPRSRYRIFEQSHPHFMTCTIVAWLPVFTRPETFEIIIDSWKHLQAHEEFVLYGYVILENHLHLIASAPELSAAMKNFKSFTARQIIDLLESRSVSTLLAQLELHKRRHKTQSQYQLWEEGHHPQQIQDDEMLLQKLEYMHMNPVKRGYVGRPEHWRYSSARDYLGQPGRIQVCTKW